MRAEPNRFRPFRYEPPDNRHIATEDRADLDRWQPVLRMRAETWTSPASPRRDEAVTRRSPTSLASGSVGSRSGATKAPRNRTHPPGLGTDSVAWRCFASEI